MLIQNSSRGSWKQCGFRVDLSCCICRAETSDKRQPIEKEEEIKRKIQEK